MITKKGHFLRFSLTHAECGYDHVQVYAVYSGVKDHPRGNCKVEYWVRFEDYGFMSLMFTEILSVTKETMLDKIKAHLFRRLEEQIREYDYTIRLLEQSQQEHPLPEDDFEGLEPYLEEADREDSSESGPLD